MVEAYPLHWPQGYKRAEERIDSRFGIKGKNGWMRDKTRHESRCLLEDAVDRIGGTGLIISSNVRTRNDGRFVSSAKEPDDDPGIAIYFERDSRQVCLPCDTYTKTADNIYAIARTIEALRQVERDGIPGFLDRAFTGFVAIPEKTGPTWRQLFGLADGQPVTEKEVRTGYRVRLLIAHPDKGGSVEQVEQVQDAYKTAMAEIGGTP